MSIVFIGTGARRRSTGAEDSRETPMRTPPLSTQDDRCVEACVQIHRSVGEVFAFYQDFRNLPRFLGDVFDIEPMGAGMYRWTIEGPLGVRVRPTIRLTEVCANTLIRYESNRLP